MNIVIKNAPEYRACSARAKWFAAVQRYQDKPLEMFVKNMKKRPPTLTRSGEAEDPRGWIDFFVIQGAIKLSKN